MVAQLGKLTEEWIINLKSVNFMLCIWCFKMFKKKQQKEVSLVWVRASKEIDMVVVQ